MNINNNLIQYINELILSDDYNKVRSSKRLIALYENANSNEQAILDKAFLHLCGFTLFSLINRWDNGGLR